MKEWWATLDLASLRITGLAETARSVQRLAERQGWATKVAPSGEPLARKRQGKGGGWEYHVSLLPENAQIELHRRARRAAERAERAADAKDVADASAAWATHEKLSKGHRAEAERRMRVMMRVEALVDDGLTRKDAIAIVLPEEGVARSCYFEWRQMTRGKLRMAMLASERVTARAPAGSLHVLGNRYWAE